MDHPEAIVGNSSKVRQTESANIEKMTGQRVQIHSKKAVFCLRVWFLKHSSPSSEDLGA